MKTKEQYLEWAKNRALDMVKNGDYYGACASLVHDLRQHPELVTHPGIEKMNRYSYEVPGNLETLAKAIEGLEVIDLYEWRFTLKAQNKEIVIPEDIKDSDFLEPLDLDDDRTVVETPVILSRNEAIAKIREGYEINLSLMMLPVMNGWMVFTREDFLTWDDIYDCDKCGSPVLVTEDVCDRCGTTDPHGEEDEIDENSID